MKISFFQTYGNRLPLLKIRMEDTQFLEFINEFDLNIISLHNVSEPVREYVYNNQNIRGLKIFELKDIGYGECIKYLINFLSDKEISKFFFYQDDTFSCEIDDKNKAGLKEMVFKGNFDMVNLSYKVDHLKEQGKWAESKKNILYSSECFNLYDTDTVDFKNSGLWSFDDSCFVCSFKILRQIFDEKYFTYPDVWQAELYLKNKFNQFRMDRFITNVSFFINYNILGRNTDPKNLLNLKKNVSISNSSLELLNNAVLNG